MRHTFDNFKVDDSNREAYELCNRISKQVGKNPRLVHIHGTAGTGKTHLLEAVKRRMEEENYLSVELIEGSQLVELFIAIFKACINTDYPIEQMYPLFADADVLLIDNIQCLIGRSSTQELVGELLADMIKNGKTVLFTSEKTFEEMGMDSLKKYMEEHDLSYTDAFISVPNNTTKRELLDEFVQRQNLHLEEKDQENILKWSVTFRELNAILNQIAFQQKLEPTATNNEIIKKVFRERGRPV